MAIYLRYNGNRFPRACILNKHRKEVFHPDKRVIAFENDEAYMILKGNRRLNLNLWEFDVVKEEAKAKEVKPKITEPSPIKENDQSEAKPVERLDMAGKTLEEVSKPKKRKKRR